MALRHLLLRFTPRIGRRWVLAALAVVALGVALAFIRWTAPPPPLELLALGPDGRFQDTVAIPAAWGDTATATPDAVARLPLILGARNLGRRPVTPAHVAISVPLRFRLAAPGGRELDGHVDGGSPLITYTLDLGSERLEPERLPSMLPAHDTLWLEVVIPTWYCVALGDSIPDFVPAPPPPLGSLSTVRVFYAFEGGDLRERRTGTLMLQLDTTVLAVPEAPEPPSYPMRIDPALARPQLGALERVGSRRTRCGEPHSSMELLSTVWETPSGGRFITLDYGGTVRKHLFDLDGDGVIERESWSPDGGEFVATRRARLPIPEFLLPAPGSGAYDLARFDSLSADSLARLDALRRAMPGPGPVPGGVYGPGADTAYTALLAPPPGRGDTAGTPATESRRMPSLDELPEPRIEPRGLLGQPAPGPAAPPDTGG